MILKYRHILLLTAYFLIGCLPVLHGQIGDNLVADSLIEIYNKNQLSHEQAAVLTLEISNNANNPALSLSFARKALDHSVKIGKLNLEAAAWLNIGQAQKKLGDNDEALESLINSAKLYEKAGSQLGIASANLAIGNIYIQQEHYKMALKYYRNSVQVFRQLGDTSRLSTTLLNIGEAFRLDHQYDSALQYFGEANKLFNNMQFEIGSAYARGNIGLVLTSTGEVDSGKYALEEAINILQKVGDQYAIATYQLSMADIYNSNGELDQAIEFAERSWNGALEYQLLEQLRDASKKLSELYSLKQDHQKAFEFQSKYIAYRDSINNEATIRKMADLRTDFEVAQKQSEIDLLHKTRQNQRLVQYGLILLSILVIIIALLQYRNIRFQKKANQMLHNQKEELARKNDKLDALIATREKFFSIISHDLRGPVNAFHGLSTIINSSIKEKQYSALPEVATHIEKASLHLSMLLDNLLSWAMNQKGSLPVNPEKLNIKTIAEEVVGIFQTMAISKKIQLNSNIESPMEVWADRNAIFTILRNLVNNAVKFTPYGGSVSISAKEEGVFTCISIADSGVGIPKEKLDRLFIKKESKRTWGTSGEKGLGLGLQLVYEFVKLNYGYIEVDSKENKGTTFHIRIPSQKFEDEKVPQELEHLLDR